eukprot:15424496-Alexandrium_andersonii.AAC.1
MLPATAPSQRKACAPGEECGICPWLISGDHEYKGLDRDTLAADIASTPAVKTNFLTKLAAYEKQRNDKRGGRVKNKTAHDATTTVSATSSDKLMFKRHL